MARPIKVDYWNEKCGKCAHFLGGGNWDLCCELPHPEFPYGHLCYEWSDACDRFKKKEE